MVTPSWWRWPVGMLLLTAPVQATDTFDPATLPKEQEENYQTFRVRCSKCHVADRAFHQHMTPEGWRRYVGKMQRRPGSGISEQSGAKIIEFLLYVEAKRSAPDAVAPTPDAGSP
jgi:hypothetical protein